LTVRLLTVESQIERPEERFATAIIDTVTVTHVARGYGSCG
jgi:hypothetical protein